MWLPLHLSLLNYKKMLADVALMITSATTLEKVTWIVKVLLTRVRDNSLALKMEFLGVAHSHLLV
jgi:hypothetical protein